MVVCVQSDRLTVKDLPQEFLYRDVEKTPNELSASSFREAKEIFERHHLTTAVRRHQGIINCVTAEIGMFRENLDIRLEQSKINYRRFR